MPRLWYGSDHDGASTVTANSWISFTMPRPTARLCMNGSRPFVVKKVAFKTCAAPSASQKMFGRISAADGSVFDNSYIGNTISWQKDPTTTYEFQAITMHFADDGGAKMRAWLISGGPFLYKRGTGGTTQTPGGQYDGTPVGYVEYAEVAQPPTGLVVARDPSDANKVTFAWKPWDPKADFDAVGGTYSVSGYVVQVAKDAAFTDKVRLLYVSKGAGEAYGLYQGYDWYFRICTRNEVSEHYNLPGGIWSSSVKLAASTDAPATPGAGVGLPSGSSDAGANNDSGDTGSLSGNNENSSSNTGGAAPTTTAPTTTTVTEDVVHADVKAAKENLAPIVQKIERDANAAWEDPSANAWKVVQNTLGAAGGYVSILSTAALAPDRPQWVSLVSRTEALKTTVAQAVSAATATQTSAQNLSAAVQAAKTARQDVYDTVVAAKAKSTASNWTKVANRLGDVIIATTRAQNAATAAGLSASAAAWAKAKATASSAKTKVLAAVARMKTADLEAGRLAALDARHDVDSAVTATVVPATDYSAASSAIGSWVDAVESAIASTDDTETVTKTVTVPGSTTVPVSTGTTGGSTTVPVNTTTGGTTKVEIVYAPIPDTTANRTPSGGLLISRTARARPPGHTVYLMDRGGRQRVHEIGRPTSISYNRIRDDISEAHVVLDGDAIAKNTAMLNDLAVGRHELCIYRGDERVWEGPLTLGTFQRSRVELKAKDICHYLNRTVLKNAYSNQYPKIDFVVNRIAGIITAELGVKESLNPPVNILPFMHSYLQAGDARTTRTTLAAESTLWQHLDDLAAKAGIDYTVVGRALHIWDTSRPALGRIRALTEADFIGDAYIAEYGMELATQTFVSDGQGNFGHAGGVDDFYGEVDLLATAYDENGNAVNQDDTDPTNDTIPIEEMTEQAVRNLKGRNPLPRALKVPDNSAFRMDRGLGLDVLIPGVYVPIQATLAGRTLNQMMKLKEVRVEQDAKGERATLTLTPASESDEENTLENG